VATPKVKVVWTEKATAHLHAAYDYWAAEKSPQAADKMLERIFSAVEMLERHPGAGRTGRIAGTRELLILPTPFVVAYRLQKDAIQILALLHGARKWPEHL
jgi:toxin ParE1/3/4